jgi:hypothetical protein
MYVKFHLSDVRLQNSLDRPRQGEILYSVHGRLGIGTAELSVANDTLAKTGHKGVPDLTAG